MNAKRNYVSEYATDVIHEIGQVYIDYPRGYINGVITRIRKYVSDNEIGRIGGVEAVRMISQEYENLLDAKIPDA